MHMLWKGNNNVKKYVFLKARKGPLVVKIEECSILILGNTRSFFLRFAFME